MVGGINVVLVQGVLDGLQGLGDDRVLVPAALVFFLMLKQVGPHLDELVVEPACFLPGLVALSAGRCEVLAQLVHFLPGSPETGLLPLQLLAQPLCFPPGPVALGAGAGVGLPLLTGGPLRVGELPLGGLVPVQQLLMGGLEAFLLLLEAAVALFGLVAMQDGVLVGVGLLQALAQLRVGLDERRRVCAQQMAAHLLGHFEQGRDLLHPFAAQRVRAAEQLRHLRRAHVQLAGQPGTRPPGRIRVDHGPDRLHERPLHRLVDEGLRLQRVRLSP